MPKKGKRQGKEKGTWSEVLTAIGKGSGVARGVTLALVFCCSAAVSFGLIGRELAGRCCVLCCVLGALVGGSVSVRCGQSWAMPVGGAVGLMEFLALVVLGVLFFGGIPAGERMPEILLACLCGGVAAGILGSRRKGKRRR